MKTLLKTSTKLPVTGFLCEAYDEITPEPHLATAEYKLCENNPYDGITVTYTYRCDAHTTGLTGFTRQNVQSDTDERCLACGASISPDEPGYYDHAKGRCR